MIGTDPPLAYQGLDHLSSKKSVTRSVLFAVCGLAFMPFAGFAAEGNCADASAQARNLRIDKDKNGSAVQLLNKSAQWRVVFRSAGEITLPRQSPDANFLAYVSTERDSPWLYVQRLSTSAREPVSPLESKPTELCFDSTGSVIRVIDSAGQVTDHDISPQLRLLPGR